MSEQNKQARDSSGYLAINQNKNNPEQQDVKGKFRFNGNDLIISGKNNPDKPGVYNLDGPDIKGYVANNASKSKPSQPDIKCKFKFSDGKEIFASGWEVKDKPGVYSLSESVSNKSPTPSQPQPAAENQPVQQSQQAQTFDPDDLFGSLPGG